MFKSPFETDELWRKFLILSVTHHFYFIFVSAIEANFVIAHTLTRILFSPNGGTHASFPPNGREYCGPNGGSNFCCFGSTPTTVSQHHTHGRARFGHCFDGGSDGIAGSVAFPGPPVCEQRCTSTKSQIQIYLHTCLCSTLLACEPVFRNSCFTVSPEARGIIPRTIHFADITFLAYTFSY